MHTHTRTHVLTLTDTHANIHMPIVVHHTNRQAHSETHLTRQYSPTRAPAARAPAHLGAACLNEQKHGEEAEGGGGDVPPYLHDAQAQTAQDDAGHKARNERGFVVLGGPPCYDAAHHRAHAEAEQEDAEFDDTHAEAAHHEPQADARRGEDDAHPVGEEAKDIRREKDGAVGRGGREGSGRPAARGRG